MLTKLFCWLFGHSRLKVRALTVTECQTYGFRPGTGTCDYLEDFCLRCYKDFTGPEYSSIKYASLLEEALKKLG